jgi:hypothetical protein
MPGAPAPMPGRGPRSEQSTQLHAYAFLRSLNLISPRFPAVCELLQMEGANWRVA